MPKDKEKKPRDSRPVHYCRKADPDGTWWKTSCGLKLDKKQRAETVLATEWNHVTCRKCKENEP